MFSFYVTRLGLGSDLDKSKMHGRLKVKTTKEQEEEKRQKRAQKVKQYRAAFDRIVEKRQAGERDEEGLQISQQILEMIPDIHTLWNYRRETLEHLKETVSEAEMQRRLETERYLTETCLRANPKSYCAWHHRTWTLDHMPNPDWQRELALCTKFLSLDERNFHCWDYRRFVVRRADVAPQQELEFTEEKIGSNFSNYSCWHYRSKLLPRVYPDALGVRPINETQHKQELELVQNAAFTDPEDQSAWFYQRWLLGRTSPKQAVTRAFLGPSMGFVALAHPARVKAKDLQFLLGPDKVPVMGVWGPADGQSYSSVWIFTSYAGSCYEALSAPSIWIRLCVGDNDHQDVELDEKTASGAVRFSAKPEFGAPLSPGLSTVMQEELDACRQLLEFDPDSKWTLLTSVLLMQTIDRKAHEHESLHILNELVELDCQRAHYYKDLRSRLLVEYFLERQPTQFPWSDRVDMSGLGLTALYHAPLLSLAMSVNLNDNHLRRPLPHLSALQLCDDLHLDRNEVSSLVGWGSMPSLTKLSLRENALDDVEALAPLACCPKLQSLDLRGNPVAEGDPVQLRSQVLKVLPRLKILNGETI